MGGILPKVDNYSRTEGVSILLTFVQSHSPIACFQGTVHIAQLCFLHHLVVAFVLVVCPLQKVSLCALQKEIVRTKAKFHAPWKGKLNLARKSLKF